MTFRQKSLVHPARFIVVACALALFFGGKTAEAQIRTLQIRTVPVSPVPGNPIDSGTALRNALAGIASPSTTNRWLVKVEPGIYDMGNVSLQMRSWVDIEGSGIGMTIITGSPLGLSATVHGANNSELRLLTVEAVGTANPDVIAMANYDGASPRIYRVKLSAVGQFPRGMRNFNAAPLIEECEIQATSTSTTSTDSYGVVFAGFPPTAGRSSILRTRIAASGARTNYGVFMTNSQSLTEIRDSRIDATGGVSTHGIYAVPSPNWQSQETLQIRNTEISSSGGSTASYGINLDGGAWMSLSIQVSKVWGNGSPTAYGIRNTGPGATILQGASIVGATQTVLAMGNASIASTNLNGGPVTAAGWLGCAGVWDEAAVFYAQTCP